MHWWCRPEFSISAVVALLLTASAPAQAGGIRGEVSDALSRQPLEGVTVTLRHAQMARDVVVKTDVEGAYRAADLPGGSYQIRFSHAGHRPFSRNDITLKSEGTLRINAPLLPEVLPQDLPEIGAPPPAEAFLEPLPPALSHRESQSPVRDQQARGTCTAFGLMAALETLPGVPADLSEQWAYGQTKLSVYVKDKGQPYGEGTHLKNYLDTLRLRGVVAEAVMPYNPKAAIWSDDTPTRERFERDLGGASLFDLLSFGKTGWTVPADDRAYFPGGQAKYIEWIQRQLKAGARGVAAGYTVVEPYWSQHSRGGIMRPDDCTLAVDDGDELSWQKLKTRHGDAVWKRLRLDKTELRVKAPHKVQGGHVVTIVGYDEQGFIFKNSWGTGWGDRGYGRMSYDFHRIFADEACAIFSAGFEALTTTDSVVGFSPAAVRLKSIPIRAASGAAALSLSLVWHGPGVPVVWRKVHYKLVESRSLDIWEATAGAETAQSPAFRSGYPVEFTLGESAGSGEFLVMVKAEAADGEPVSLAFTKVRRQLAETVSSTDRK